MQRQTGYAAPYDSHSRQHLLLAASSLPQADSAPYADRETYANREPYADRETYANREPYANRDSHYAANTQPYASNRDSHYTATRDSPYASSTQPYPSNTEPYASNSDSHFAFKPQHTFYPLHRPASHHAPYIQPYSPRADPHSPPRLLKPYHRSAFSKPAPDEITLPFSGTETIRPVYLGSEQYTPSIFASVDRGFFVADGKWTCYRRNYFQTHIQVNLVSNLCMSNKVPIQSFQTTISSHIASDPNNAIVLVQHTPKRDKGPQMAPAFVTIGPDEKVVFERIQFKSATANNGKRRAQQQFFIIRVELHATIAGQDPILIGVSRSMPVVVRGRSPGHYADNGQRDDNDLEIEYLNPTLPFPSHRASPPTPPNQSTSPNIARKFPQFYEPPLAIAAYHGPNGVPTVASSYINYQSPSNVFIPPAPSLTAPLRMPTPHSPTPSLSPTEVSPVPSSLNDEFTGYMYFPYPLNQHPIVDCNYEPHGHVENHRPINPIEEEKEEGGYIPGGVKIKKELDNHAAIEPVKAPYATLRNAKTKFEQSTSSSGYFPGDQDATRN
ncbi:Transcription factor vib-1 [Neolecta irregularis DAH-3]|uniref:Transcription factor vib-1 n=1 Tax=Neolecta irregularis (strain DAH-3) TaxID=1198029 RepID=A0A1U7LQY2_NEOID|nr:Transcription factor vib-1 [Neolecta irregularis DAH-3]|eukprot:OLL24962.1 Transcription factor vib-1 [Neolecta irregularis DAH-3]